jgi:hypothetical protein
MSDMMPKSRLPISCFVVISKEQNALTMEEKEYRNMTSILI